MLRTYETSINAAVAKLGSNTTQLKIRTYKEYVNTKNRTANSLAKNQLSGDAGMVTLTDEYTTAMNLPLVIRNSWDPSKSVYLLQGYHNLHCLVSSSYRYGGMCNYLTSQISVLSSAG